MRTLLTLVATFCIFASSAFAQKMDYHEMLSSPEYQEASELLENAQFNKGAGDNVLKFLAENPLIRNFLLQKMLNVRCERYLSLFEETQCSMALWSMIGDLDFDVKITQGGQGSNWRPKSFIFVAFKEQLISLLNNERTSLFLENILLKMSSWRADPNKNPFNLWDSAVSFYKSEKIAAMVLAILFQDTSVSQSHMEYLHKENVRGNAYFVKNINLLSTSLTFLSDIQRSDNAGFNKAVYPKSLAGQFNSNLYHFYVPYFLGIRLMIDGHTSKYSTIAPSILSSTYEFITTKEDMTYIYSDPERITNDWKLKDIHSGYIGARWGAGLKAGAPSLSKLKAQFSLSTKNGMELMFNSL
ncbi:MAG: hypothetical protein K2P81_09035 [Bacteriovoracaceae bacterium]|nr:hypothetical protein [Bacteriovoracaceae bacterium]